MKALILSVLLLSDCAGSLAAPQVCGIVAHDGKGALQALQVAALEPDYEEEKLRFQRGTEPYYGLDEYILPPGVDYAQARALLSTAALHGDGRAAIFLGVMSEQGRGGEQDYAQARRGDLGGAGRHSGNPAQAKSAADAEFMLGMMYFQGKGVLQDDALALAWFEQAAAHNSGQAQVNIGWMYQNQRGVKQDYVRARQWYAKAARYNDVLGLFNLATLFYEGKGVPQSIEKAGYWLLKAANGNYVPAQYSLGVIALGDTMKNRAGAAYGWFRLAQQASYPGATQNIAKALSRLTPAEIGQADDWLQKWRTRHACRPLPCRPD